GRRPVGGRHRAPHRTDRAARGPRRRRQRAGARGAHLRRRRRSATDLSPAVSLRGRMETVLTRTRWAVLAVAPALLLGAACASTGGTAQAPPAPQAGEDTGATAPADTDELPAATEADAEEITAVTHTFVTGDNNGDAAMLGRALCTQSLTEVDLEGRGPSARPQI